MTNRAYPFFVTLNLLQGPSCGVSGGRRTNTRLAVGSRFKPIASGHAEGWTLKQVQGDDEGEGIVSH